MGYNFDLKQLQKLYILLDEKKKFPIEILLLMWISSVELSCNEGAMKFEFFPHNIWMFLIHDGNLPVKIC